MPLDLCNDWKMILNHACKIMSNFKIEFEPVNVRLNLEVWSIKFKLHLFIGVKSTLTPKKLSSSRKDQNIKLVNPKLLMESAITEWIYLKVLIGECAELCRHYYWKQIDSLKRLVEQLELLNLSFDAKNYGSKIKMDWIIQLRFF